MALILRHATPGALGARAVRWGWALVWTAALSLGVLLAWPAWSSVDEDVGVLAGMLQDLLSDAGRDVRIRGFEGALSSRATITEISISDSRGVWITLQNVVIDWNRAALFNGQVEVNEFSAATIDLFRLPVISADGALPSTTASEGFSLPELPVSVNIGELRADLVRLNPEVIGQQAEISLLGTMALEGGEGSARFEAQRTDIQQGAFQFDGSFNNLTRVLSLDLTLDEAPGGVAASLLGIPGEPALGLTVRGTGPLETFNADIAVSTDATPRVSGRFALVDQTPDSGVLQGGGFSLDVDGDLRPFLNPELHPFFGARSLLRATGQRSENGEISFPDLTVSTEALDLQGRASFGADGLPRLVRVTAAVQDPTGAPVLLPGSGGQVRLASASLIIRYDESVSRDWSVRAEIDALDMPSASIGTAVLDARGRLNTLSANPSLEEGTPTAPALEGVFDFIAQNIDAADPAMQRAVGSEMFGFASLSWPGPGAPVDITGLALEGETVSLTAYGSLEGLTFDGYLELEAPDLSAFSGLAGRPLGGNAYAVMQGAANPVTGALDFRSDLVTTNLTVDTPEADALLAGESRISVSLLRDTEGTQLRDFTLSAGTIEATMQGALTPDLVDLRARLAASDLARMGEGYGGRLAMDFQLATQGGGQRLRFDGSTIDLQLADRLPAADMLGGLLDGANRLRGDLTLFSDRTEVSLLSVEGPFVSLVGSGRWSDADPDLSLSLERLDLAGLSASGTGVVAGNAQILGMGDGVRRVALDLGGDGVLRSGVAQLDGLLSDGARLSAELRIDPQGGVLIERADLTTAGLTVTAQGTQASSGALDMVVRGQLDDAGLLVPGMRGAMQLNAAVARAAGAGFYDLQADLSGLSQLSLTTRGQIADDLTLALSFSGQVDGAVVNPSIEPQSVQGLIRVTGSLEGPPGLDSLRLVARTSGGRYAQPGAGVAFREIEAEARLSGLNAWVSLTGVSFTGGTGTLEGTIALADDRQADLTLAVDGFTVRQARLFEARVTGVARLVGPLQTGALLSGEVTVDQAEIFIPNSPLGRQGFGPQGLVHVAESNASRQTREAAGIASGTRGGRQPVPLALDLTLNAPGRVFVRGRGLDAELGGTLRLGGTTRAVVPAGSFGLIRGRLDLLGNRFTLTDGSASMIGDFVPMVTLVASTESDGVTTSVRVSGRADGPEITFQSIPELPQDEVLARLIFRRSLISLSPFQAAQLALSVATLTGRADESILSRTRQAMGLDDLDFTVDDQGNTALRAGRYLSADVYTDLSIDSTGRSEVSINLDLSPSVTLRGRADTEGRSGIGVFFERDY